MNVRDLIPTERERGIGASEIAAVVEKHPWLTRYELWLTKLGLAEPREGPQLEIGHLLEDDVATLYARHTGTEPQAPPHVTVRHREAEWASASPDRLIVAEDGTIERGVELKTSAMRLGWGATDDPEGVPEHYRLQVQWSMEVLDVDLWDVGAFLAGADFRRYELARDRELGAYLLGEGGLFWWDYVVPQVEPPVESSQRYLDLLSERWRETRPVTIEATAGDDLLAYTLVQLRTQGKELFRRSRRVEAELKRRMGASDRLKGANWNILWRRGKERISYDTLALLQDPELPPHLIDRYTRRVMGSRPFHLRWKAPEEESGDGEGDGDHGQDEEPAAGEDASEQEDRT